MGVEGDGVQNIAVPGGQISAVYVDGHVRAARQGDIADNTTADISTVYKWKPQVASDVGLKQ